MSETTLATPLSGQEIMEAVRHRIDGEVVKALRRDCYLNPALAYEGFDADIHIQMNMRDNGRIAVIDVRIHLEDRPPNEVREAAGLGIPTLVESSTGNRELKSMKYGARETPTEKEPQTEPGETPSPEQPQEPKRPEPPKPAEPKPSQIRR